MGAGKGQSGRGKLNRVGGGGKPPPLTPPDMRVRIRRFIKKHAAYDTDRADFPALRCAKRRCSGLRLLPGFWPYARGSYPLPPAPPVPEAHPTPPIHDNGFGHASNVSTAVAAACAESIRPVLQRHSSY